MKNDYEKKIIETLQGSSEPMDVEKIRVAAGIGHWSVTLAHCLELLCSKKINGRKTTKSWVFWIEGDGHE